MRDQLTGAVLEYQRKILAQLQRDVPADDQETAPQLRTRRGDMSRLASSQVLVRDTPVVIYAAKTEVEAAANADQKPLLEFLDRAEIRTSGGLNGEQCLAAAMMIQSLDRFGPGEWALRVLLAKELWRRFETAPRLLQIFLSDADHLPAVHASDWDGLPAVVPVRTEGGRSREDEEPAGIAPEVDRSQASHAAVLLGHRPAVRMLAPALLVLLLLVGAFVLWGPVQRFDGPDAARDWSGPSAIRITEPAEGDIEERWFTVRGSYLAGGAFRDVWIFVFPHDSCAGEPPGPWSPHCPGWVQSPRMEEGLPALMNHQQRTFAVGVWLGGEDLQNPHYDLVAFLGDETAASRMRSYMKEPSAATAGPDRQESAAQRGLRYDQLPSTLVELDRITVVRGD